MIPNETIRGLLDQAEQEAVRDLDRKDRRIAETQAAVDLATAARESVIAERAEVQAVLDSLRAFIEGLDDGQ